MRDWRAIAFAALAAWSAMTASSQGGGPATDADVLRPEWGVIFPASQAPSIAFMDARKIAGSWEPTVDDVKELDALLAPAMRPAFARQEMHPPHPRNYYRQYGGIYALGKRLIVVNGFHRLIVEQETIPCSAQRTADCSSEPLPSDYWKHKAVGAFDGGCEFFHAAFDTKTHAFIYLFCQGDA